MFMDAEPEYLPYNVLLDGTPMEPIKPLPPVEAEGMEVGDVAE